jgi:signal transduction histidine kinase
MLANKVDDLRTTLLARLREREEQVEFLTNAGKLMSRTNELAGGESDVETTLAALARLALPYEGVWTILDVLEDTGIRRVAISHPDPSLQPLADRLLGGWPPPRDAPGGGVRVLRTGVSEIISVITDERLVTWADSPDHLAVLRALAIGSVLAVPLKGDGRILGAVTFVSPRGGHVFDDRDRHLAEDLAASAAMAIVNARHAAERARSRSAAEAAAAAMTGFMSSLTHGVRTSLHNIFGYAQLLEAGVRGPLSEQQRGDIGRIRENERHLLNLVDAVINFARWSDDDPPVMEDVSVCDALAAVDGAILSAAAKKGVVYDGVHATLSPELVVRAEPVRLHEILKQLLRNAVQYCRPGDSIIVDALRVGRCVWIRVSDTGIGISADDLAVIFHPFVRGRHAYVRAQDGVGLGLAVTQKLARAMEGELSVVSRPRQGTTFTLSLPCGRQSLKRATA